MYNDSLGKFFTGSALSQLVVVKVNDKLYESDLVNVGPTDLDVVRRLLGSRTGGHDWNQGHETVQTVGENSYSLTEEFHELVRRGRDSFVYNLTVENIGKVYGSSPCLNKSGFKEYQELLKSNRRALPWWSHFTITRNGDLYAFGNWYAVDRIGGRPGIGLQSAVFHYRNDKLMDASPISLDVVKNKSLFIPNFIMPAGDDRLMMSYIPASISFDTGLRNPYMGVFERSNGCYRLKEYVQAELPDAYKYKIGPSYIGFFAADDRYIALTASDEIYDLERKVYYKTKIYEDYGMTVPTLSQIMADAQNVPLFNEALTHDSRAIYLLSKIKGRQILSTFDVVSSTISSHFNLEDVFTRIISGIALDMNGETRSIYFPLEDGRIRIYPLEFAYSRVPDATAVNPGRAE